MAHAQATGKSTPKAAKGALPHFAGGGFIDGVKGMLGIKPDSPELVAYKARAAAEREAAKNPPKQQPAPTASNNGIADYVGNSALQRREKAAGLASGGLVQPNMYKMGDMSGDVSLTASPSEAAPPIPLKVGGAIRGPGTSTSDDVPIMASNGEFMLKAAAVKKIGLPVLEALNEIADDEPASHEAGESKKVEAKEVRDEKAGRPEADGMKCGGAVRKMATGGLVTEDDKPKPFTQTSPMQVSPEMAAYNASVASARQLAANKSIAPTSTPAQEVAGIAAYTAANQKANDATPFFNYFQQKGPGGSVAETLRAQADKARVAIYQGSAPQATSMQAASSQPPDLSTLPRASYSNEGRAPTPIPASARGALPAQAAAPVAPSNSFGDGASWNSNRTPMNAQDQGAMDGIQARQDARDSAGLQKMQYDAEVENAQAINKATADRSKTPRQLALQAQIEQNVRGAETERYRADQGLASTKLSTDANRYGTDAQRETAKGSLGVAQGRLAMDQETQGYENRAKGALEKLQVQLDGTTDEAQRAAIMRTMQTRQGKAASVDEFSYAPGGQSVDPVTGQLITQPGVIFNKRNGQEAPRARTSIAADPRAAAIRDNKTMTRDQKLAELKKMGYQ